MHRESLIMHDEKISRLVKIYASREDFMPRSQLCDEKISCLVKIYTSREEFMPRWKSCIAEIMHRESIIMHDEKISCLVKIYTSREEFMPRWNSCIAESCIAESCIAEIMHRESIIMHDEKISCLIKIYTSREEFMPRWKSCIAESCIAEIMHRESIIMHDEKISCLVKIYTSREDFMPRRKLCIARRFHTSQEFTYRGKIFMPRKRTYMDKERAILIHWPRLHSVISYKSKHQGEHRRWQQKKRQYRISISLFRHQVWNTLKMILQNTRHKLYLLDVRPIESTSNMEENNEVSTCLCREHPKGWILQKPQVRTTSKRMQHNVELFLEANWDIVQRGKLLGREQRSDFHHNQTTPLS